MTTIKQVEEWVMPPRTRVIARYGPKGIYEIDHAFSKTFKDAIKHVNQVYGHRDIEIVSVEPEDTPDIDNEQDFMAWEEIVSWTEKSFRSKNKEIFNLVMAIKERFKGESIRNGSTRMTVICDDYVYKVPFCDRGIDHTIREDEWDPDENDGAQLAQAEIIEWLDFDDVKIPVLKMEKVVKNWTYRDHETGEYNEHPSWFTNNKVCSFDGFQGGWTKSGELVLYDP